MEFKAEYNFRPHKCSKGKNIIVKVLELDKISSKIELEFFASHIWVSNSKLKPYLDPDAEGSQWILLGYIIMKNNHPKLPTFTIFNNKEQYIGYTHQFKNAQQLIIKTILKEKGII